MSRKRLGRPSGLNDKVQAAFISALEQGCTVKAASAAAGVPKASVYRWLEKGKNPRSEKVFRDFRDAVMRAREKAAAALVVRVQEGASRDWRAATWLLARLDAENFGEPGSRMSAEQEARMAEAKVRRAEAEARLVEAKARAAEALAKQAETGELVIESTVDLMESDESRAMLRAALRAVKRDDVN